MAWDLTILKWCLLQWGLHLNLAVLRLHLKNHSLYMFWIKAFAALFTLILRGWNLLVKLWGTILITTVFWAMFSEPIFILTFEIVHDNKNVLFFWVSIFCFNHLEMLKDNLPEKLNRFFGVRPMIFCVTKWERAWKFKLW